MQDNIVVAYSNPKSPVAEAYRVLRTNIQYSSVDKQLKTIVVTSSGPMEGKTTTAVNIAVTFAQAGNSVLLIDSDMRKPRIHRIFSLKSSLGLTNLLVAHDSLRKCLSKCAIPKLDILPCGTIPPNPSELLSSIAMKQFMQEVVKDYDIVIMDAPPVGRVTDAAIISTYVDGTILVAHSGRVEAAGLKRAKELLDKVNANILGVVLNRLDKHASGNSYYYQYDYYNNEGRGRKRGKYGISNNEAITFDGERGI